VVLAVGSHVTASVGTALEPQLLVRGTELVQVSSPVQSAHYSPDPLARTGRRSRFLADTYAGCFASGQLAVLKLLAKVPTQTRERNGRNASCARLLSDFLRNPHTSTMQHKPTGISALVLEHDWPNRNFAARYRWYPASYPAIISHRGGANAKMLENKINRSPRAAPPLRICRGGSKTNPSVPERAVR
jgi:hypothetical protein